MPTEITGKITRLIPPDNSGNAARVFIRPTDPSVLLGLDGNKYCASGEVPVSLPQGAKVDDLKVGQEYTATIF
jgi:hypothetical protein